jgi:hypothetical protein
MFKTVLVIAVVISTAFGFALDWAIHFDYVNTFIPMGVAMILGFLTAGAWGGVLGAWLDYQTEKLEQCKANHPAGKLI